MRFSPLALILGLAGLAAVYAGLPGAGFLSDDFAFLEQAAARPLAAALASPAGPGGYLRPLSRAIYFGTLGPLAGGHPAVFHLVNLALFLVALLLLADLLLALLPAPAAAAGLAYFALLPLQRVVLVWISCAQDLLALALALGAFALHRRGRRGGAALTFLAAVASKESALALPFAALAWDRLIERRAWRSALARTGPLFAIAAGWGALALRVADRTPGPQAPRLDAAGFVAGLAHGIQSLAGLENPAGLVRALGSAAPSPIAFALLVAAGFVATGGGGRGSGGSHSPASAGGRVLAFAGVWIAAFALVTGPVAAVWSGYFYTLAAIGGALLVGLIARRIERWGWALLMAALLWWHAAGSAGAPREAWSGGAPAPGLWNWTSRVTAGYLERAAQLSARISDDLRRLDPAPPSGSRLFFATLPPNAGFQMGNGALVRALYRDPTLESYFYSQFSESTADARPCRFFYWDGRELRGLYANVPDPLFQVGCDLLLLDQNEGAAHAFRQAIARGGRPVDNLYWLGWAELWSGRRPAAEAAWARAGVKDDSLSWLLAVKTARLELVTVHDTLAARRLLSDAIWKGIGLPQAHGMLGELLLARQPKYGMLELKVTCSLNPDDYLARRSLVDALVQARLDDAARRQLAELVARRPEMRDDAIVTRARATLERRGAEAGQP